MTDALREAAQQALEALEGVITDLRAAKAESERDWSLLAATQESLREHMAEVQRLRAALAQPATIAEWWAAKQAASGEPVAWQERQEMRPGEFGEWYERSTGWSMRRPAEIESSGIRYQFRPLYAAPQPAPAPAASGEPVAWIQPDHLQKAKHAPFLCRVEPTQRCADFVPLYTAQSAPARVPLTDEQINRITIEQWGAGLGAPYAAYRAYARAIEAAHGITPAKEAP